eukprot:TRINITY_DN31366_c0_g1_i1.p2 TRINITY_DN31366_c0_g1~~TRINITY_DN31366_c0_g1_i1.p2  ORF type:complete len:135 (-),score=9.63 TRINITY_DN31366_c0_g1_i1:172-576(-)
MLCSSTDNHRDRHSISQERTFREISTVSVMTCSVGDLSNTKLFLNGVAVAENTGVAAEGFSSRVEGERRARKRGTTSGVTASGVQDEELLAMCKRIAAELAEYVAEKRMMVRSATPSSTHALPDCEPTSASAII